MEDATVALSDFRDTLSPELAALAPGANSFFGVNARNLRLSALHASPIAEKVKNMRHGAILQDTATYAGV